MNLIGASVFINKPQKALKVYRTLSSFWAGSGDETSLGRLGTVLLSFP